MTQDRSDPHTLPSNLPAPVDDGAARHLRGAKLPPIELASTDGDTVNLAELALTRAMKLPTFDFPVASGGPNTLLRRMGWFVDTGVIEELWYPVFPPDGHARRVLDWLDSPPR